MATPPEYGQNPPAPTCYRHSGRPTYVSCVRCGRPACPDCLRPAAVGHQCVECIREGSKGVRQATGRFGGTAATNGRVTWVLIGINLLLYVVMLAHPSLEADWWLFAGNKQLGGVADGQWYRLITSAFLPGAGGLGVLDIAFNMWALFLVGPAIERVLGPLRYLAVYLASALGGAVCYLFIVPPGQPALGASGAIFGLFGAWFVLSRRLGVDSRQVVFLIVLNLAIGFVGHSYIAWQDHVGGLVTGAVITAAYAYAPRKNRGLIQLAATVAVLALLLGGVLLRNYQLVHQVIL
jgi:membrane associated rhomboid family serine protease